MKWVEMITLRSFGRSDPQLVDQILSQVDTFKTPGQPADIRTYRHSLINTDVSVHIHWDKKNEIPEESPLGHHLSYALKDLGLINHSIWIESDRIGEKGQTRK